jgi:homoserine O-succinyltransferase
MKRTETQWLQYMSHSVLQIEPVLVKFDDDKRERVGASRAEVLNRYRPFREVADSQIDGLIVTGDNLELRQSPDADPTDPLPFEEISYAEQLADVIDWARSNVRSTIYSCLASHFVLDYLYGVEREVT